MPCVTKFPVRTHDDPDDTRQLTWVDLDLSNVEARHWLTTQSGLSERATAFLLQPAKVNQRENLTHGLLVRFCGIDPHEPLSKEELLWLGLVIEPDRVMTVRSQTIRALAEVRTHMQAGQGPASPFAFLVVVATTITEGLEATLTDVFEETDGLEDQVLAEGTDPPLEALNTLRRKVFRIRRSVLPFHNVLKFIASDPTITITTQEREALNRAAEHVAYHLDSLEDCRGRAQLLYDQIAGQLAATMARVTYNLTIVATVFLPLTFITGLLGINVGGIPEAHNPWGFWIVCIVLTVCAAIAWVILRRRRVL